MKKICFIATVPGTFRGFVLDLVEYLHKETDYDISLMCSPIEDFDRLVPNYVHFIPMKMERGVNLSGFRTVIEMVKVFRHRKFDLVQYSTPNASFYAAIASKIARVPVRLYCQWGLVFEGFSGIKRKLFMLTEKVVCSLSTWIEPDSFGNLNYCRDLGLYDDKKSSVVLYGSAKGVSLAKFDISQKECYREEIRSLHHIPENSFVFGFVGSLTRDKGINELIEAFRSIMECNYNVFLFLIGPYEKIDSINEELLTWAQKNDRVLIEPTKYPEKYYSAMDCYITASYREGFGTTVIEAGAMGLPIITSDIPGPTDVIKNGINGIVIPKKNPEALLNAMKEMYTNKMLCKQYGEENHKIVVDKYEQKKVFSAILKDRERLLND